MADPRYADIGLAPDYAAQSAESFYNTIPELSFNGNVATPQFQDQYDIEAAYEKNLASEIQAIDPSDPEYEAKIVDWSVSKEDPDAINYPRVKAAIRAGATRAKMYRDQLTSRQESNQRLGMQLAEAGVPPDKLVDYQDANGNYDPYRVAYTTGQIKLGRGGDKTDPSSPSESLMKQLWESYSTISSEEYTDDEKKADFKSREGRELNPNSKEEWDRAYEYTRQKKMKPVQDMVRFYQAQGKNFTDDFLQLTGVQTSQVQSTPESQSTPPLPPSTDAQSQAMNNPEVDPTLSVGQAIDRKQEIADQQKKQTARELSDSKWTSAKDAMESQLLQSVGGDRNKLTQVYRSVMSGEGILDPTLSEMEQGTDNAVDVGEFYLKRSGINPNGITRDSFGLDETKRLGTAPFKNYDLLRVLAEDRLRLPQNKPVVLPSGTSYSVGEPRKV